MPANIITVVGLGPGHRALLTVGALDALRDATLLYLSTSQHPLLEELEGDLRPDVRVQTFDDLDTPAASDAETAATRIAATLLEVAAAAPVYAVPGHPLIGNAAVRLLLQQAALQDVEVRLVAGLSAVETVADALQLDPLATGLYVVDAESVAAPVPATSEGLTPLWAGSSSRLLNAQAPLLVDNISTTRLLPDVARRLLERYPAAHPVRLVRDGGTPRQRVEELPLEGLARVSGAANGGSSRLALYVPALAPLDDLRAPNTLGYITARLRGPGGCPWDREQTHTSLTPYMIEEAYEAVDAVERDDMADMVEELGDVLLQVVLHSQLAEEEGRFSLADVAAAVNEKLVRRHPHVFGDVRVSGSSEALRNWEQIKRAEKGAQRQSALDGIPPTLPALSLAQTIGRKVAKLGFDWPDVEGTFAKVREELDEIRAARDDGERREEIGDLLYALTSVCRHLGVDAEDALRAATRKFAQRFRRVETYARERNLNLAALPIEDLDALWEEAKSTNDREGGGVG